MLADLAVPALWLFAALGAGRLPGARTAAGLRRRALLTLVAAGAAFAGGLLMAPPPLTVLAVVALGLAVPRLIRLRAAGRGLAAAGRHTPAPPLLRAAAAHPAIVVPILASAYGSFIQFGPSIVPTGASAAAVAAVAAVAVAAPVSIGWLAARRRRLLAVGGQRNGHRAAGVPERGYGCPYGAGGEASEVELAVLRSADERIPLFSGEDQRASVGML